ADLRDLPGRLAAAAELDGRLATWCAGRDKHAAMATLQAAGVAAGAVQHAFDLRRDPQLAARGFFPRVAHPTRGPMTITGTGPRLGPIDASKTWTGRPVGEANAEVFRDLLGLSQDEIAALRSAGAIEAW